MLKAVSFGPTYVPTICMYSMTLFFFGGRGGFPGSFKLYPLNEVISDVGVGTN